MSIAPDRPAPLGSASSNSEPPDDELAVEGIPSLDEMRQELVRGIPALAEKAKQEKANHLASAFVWVFAGGMAILMLTAPSVIFNLADVERWEQVFDRFWTAMTLILGFLLGHYFPQKK